MFCTLFTHLLPPIGKCVGIGVAAVADPRDSVSELLDVVGALVFLVLDNYLPCVLVVVLSVIGALLLLFCCVHNCFH